MMDGLEQNKLNPHFFSWEILTEFGRFQSEEQLFPLDELRTSSSKSVIYSLQVLRVKNCIGCLIIVQDLKTNNTTIIPWTHHNFL